MSPSSSATPSTTTTTLTPKRQSTSTTRRHSKRSPSSFFFNDQGKNDDNDHHHDSTLTRLARSISTNKQTPIPGVQVLKERRRRSSSSFLGPRDLTNKRLSLNSNLLYSTSSLSTSPLSSSDYVKQKPKVAFASNPARHSIAVVPMAYGKDTTNITTSHTQAHPQLHLKTNLDLSEDQASICHSPTWADEKSKKKSSGWAWRKSSHPKLKKEELAQEEELEIERTGKPGRKLNKKPPPPAMETQRQSATLTTGVASSESLQMDRRPSSSGSLTQVMRGFLSRSSQNNSPETSRPTSISGLQPPVQEPISQDLSRRPTFERVKYEEDETYVNDIADFVNEMEASARAVLSQSLPSSDAPGPTTEIPAPLNTPPRSRDQESAVPSPMISQAQAQPQTTQTRSTSVPASIRRIFGKKDNAAGGYKYPDLNGKLSKDQRFQGQKSPSSNKWLNRSVNAISPTEVVLRSPETSTVGGYVQRQRMLQHERSIVGFQDEMAVKSAYEQLLSDSQLPPTPKDSTESVHSDHSEPQLQTNRGPIEASKRGPTSWKAPSPPSKQIKQNKASRSPQRWPLPASPVQSPEKKSFSPFKSSNEKVRPAPVAIQSPNSGKLNYSLPNIPQLSKPQSDETTRQSKNSAATVSSSTSTVTSSSSILTGQISPVYQLPPVTTSFQTSPISSKFPGESSEGISPPAINLNDNSIRLVPTVDRKDDPLPPLPAATISKPVIQNELLVASENAEGILRKTSIKRHRSDPELKVPQLKVEQEKTDLPSLDFLPELRHQAFTKPKRTSRVTFAPASPTKPPLSPSQFPLPSSTTELARRPDGHMRKSNRTTMVGSGILVGAGGTPPKPIAKLFVICCQCKFWHDLPSKLYEAMALPQAVGREDNIAGGMHQKTDDGQHTLPDGEARGFQGKIFTQVKCPWCPHCLSTSCCQGWTAITYLHERHH